VRSTERTTAAAEAEVSEEANCSDRVTIGIINYNGRECLPETMKAVKQLEYPSLEVIVVDNDSTDGSREWLEDNHPDVRCVRLSRNIGLPGARNVALREAKTEYVLVMDNDISVQPDTLSRLMEVMKSISGVGACHPEMTDPNDTEVHHYNGGSIHYLCVLVSRPRPKADEVRPWFEQFDVTAGGALLMRRDVALQIGGFDSDYFFNWEDGDFTVRLTLAGYKVLNIPAATVRHRSKPRGKSKVFYQVRNRWYFILKMYSWQTIVLILPMLAFFEIAQGSLLLLKGAGKEYIKGSLAAFGDLPRTLRKRRAFQQFKIMKDSAWLTGGPMYVTVGRSTGRVISAAQGLLYSFFNLYWLPVKLAVRLFRPKGRPQGMAVGIYDGLPVKINPAETGNDRLVG
jgi:GT2 family glycosyltransferase